jgi:hypothetical protein
LRTFAEAVASQPFGTDSRRRTGEGEISLQEISALVQIGANLAVLASVLFLAVQARLGIQMLKDAAQRNHMDKAQSVSRMIAENPQLAELWARGSKLGIAKLNEAERVQFVNFLTYVLRIWEELFLQHQRGLIDEEMWQANARIVCDTKPMPGARDAWAVRRHLFTEAFQQFFESLDNAQARPLYEVEPS